MLVKWSEFSVKILRFSNRGQITTSLLPEGSYYGETGFLANTNFRGSMRFSTPLTKGISQTSDASPDAGLPTNSISLRREPTDRSTLNNSYPKQPVLTTQSSSGSEYLQSHTFVTQTYADLRYITRMVVSFFSSFVILNRLSITLSQISLDINWRESSEL